MKRTRTRYFLAQHLDLWPGYVYPDGKMPEPNEQRERLEALALERYDLWQNTNLGAHVMDISVRYDGFNPVAAWAQVQCIYWEDIP